MRHYKFTITGKTPLLMHWDNLTWQERVTRWRSHPDNQKYKVAGDDRSPPWSWVGAMYGDGEQVCIPSDNIMRCLMEGGAGTPVGRGAKTYKAQTQSGMLVHDENVPLLVGGESIDHKQFLALEGEMDFAKHEALAVSAGFVLYTKRVKMNGKSRNIRVRPRFDRWSLVGQLDVWDEQLTEQVLTTILNTAGKYKGLGDWRPSSKTPGPFGTFDAALAEIR
jgi:hypothetical protein